MLSFYRKKSAFNITTTPATLKTLDSGIEVLKDYGAIFVKGAQASGNREYDWKNGLIMAIGQGDIPYFYNGYIEYLRDPKSVEINIVHDPHAKSSKQGEITKNLMINYGDTKTKNGKQYNTYFINILENNKGKKSKVAAAISEGELLMLFDLVKTYYPYIMGLIR